MIKENTVNALKNALRKKGGATMNDNDEKSFLAAKALGTLTQHRKAARHIGRDEEAIQTVLDSIRNKPKFGRLVTYSLNCLGNFAQNKHNWEGIVELGGIEVTVGAMRQHVGNPGVLKESSRIVSALCKNKQYASTIANSGVLELALDSLQKNPDGCGVSAMKIIDDILTACPEAAERLIAQGGIDTITKALERMKQRPDVAQALVGSINLMCNIDTNICEQFAQSGVAKHVLDALRIHPQIAQLSLDAVEALTRFANLDATYKDFLKDEGIVSAISTAMECNPELKRLIEQGAASLHMFADENGMYIYYLFFFMFAVINYMCVYMCVCV